VANRATANVLSNAIAFAFIIGSGYTPSIGFVASTRSLVLAFQYCRSARMLIKNPADSVKHIQPATTHARLPST
jgi:hypothetical protein